MYFLKKRKKRLEFMFMKHYAPNRCEPSIEALNFGGGGGGMGDQGRCERRSEVFVKLQKKYLFFFLGGEGSSWGGGVGSGWGGGQGRYNREVKFWG